MIFEDIDRSIFESIRISAVALGYLPNVTDYTTPEEFRLAKEIIIGEKGQIVEVFGVGNSESRDGIIPTKIVINRMNTSKGEIGAFPATEFEKIIPDPLHPEVFQYIKKLMPPHTEDLEYDVRLITNSIKMERIGLQVIIDAIGQRKFIPSIGVIEGKYLIVSNGNINLTKGTLIEHSLKFIAKDIFLTDSTILLEGIPPMTTVTGTTPELF